MKRSKEARSLTEFVSAYKDGKLSGDRLGISLLRKDQRADEPHMLRVHCGKHNMQLFGDRGL